MFSVLQNVSFVKNITLCKCLRSFFSSARCVCVKPIAVCIACVLAAVFLPDLSGTLEL